MTRRAKPFSTRPASWLPEEAPCAPPQSVTAWFEKHEFACLGVAAAIGLILRLLLALGAAHPYGYIYDFYHIAIELFNQTGRLPTAASCWQGYHPPLYYLLGLAFYKLGALIGRPVEAVCLMSMLCGLASVFYGYRILRLYRQRGLWLVLGTVFLLMSPCLFIGSYGTEADSLLTSIMIAFLYYLLRYHTRTRRAGARDPLILGFLAGLAISTKYSGLIAPLLAVQILMVHMLDATKFNKALRDGLIVLSLCFLIGFWKYYDNYNKYYTFFHANGTAAEGFAVSNKQYHWDRYEFFTLRLGVLFKILSQNNPPYGQLTDLKVYYSVPTSLHAQAWGDMSIFTEPSRHGQGEPLYLSRGIPLWLSGSVLILAILPNLLAGLGLAITARRRTYLPLLFLLVTTMAIYIVWMISQTMWAVKTKYIIFLWPVYVIYMLVGIRWVQRHAPPRVSGAVMLLLALLIVVTHLYLYQFAVGR